MDAVLRVFKRVNGASNTRADGTTQASSTPATCSVRLLVPASQAINLIGKQGASIKSIQENTGAAMRIIARGTYMSSILQENYVFVQIAHKFIMDILLIVCIYHMFVLMAKSYVYKSN